jgi:hypothetical protein
VSGALDGFEHNWKDGRKEIDGQLEGLSKMAATAVQEIRTAGKDLADQLAPAGRAARATAAATAAPREHARAGGGRRSPRR